MDPAGPMQHFLQQWPQYGNYYPNYGDYWDGYVPPLAIRVEGLTFHYQLTDDDVRKVFSRYGPVQSVDVRRGGNLAYIQYSSINHALSAIQDLDGKTLAGLKGGKLRVSFENGSSTGAARWPTQSWGWPATADASPTTDAAAARKFTCKVEFDIDNCKEFRVSSRVIAVARRIWQELPHFQELGGKTRLRGRGSGFLEGPDQKEAEEPLHLCISCRDQSSFEDAVAMAVKEIQQIQRDFIAFRKQKGLPAPKHLGCRVERQTRGGPPDETQKQNQIRPLTGESNDADKVSEGKKSGGKRDNKSNTNAII